MPRPPRKHSTHVPPAPLPPLTALGLEEDGTLDFDVDWCPSTLSCFSAPPSRWRLFRRPIVVGAILLTIGASIILLLAALPDADRQDGGDRALRAANTSEHHLAPGPPATPGPRSAIVASTPVPVVIRREPVIASSTPLPNGWDDQHVATPEASRLSRFDESVLYWLPEILAAAEETGVSPSLVAGVIRVESNGVAEVRSPVGAQGLMQVMPVHFVKQGIAELQWTDPATNIRVGTSVLGWMIEQHGTHWDGIAHYFGIGCDVNMCTDAYVRQVLAWEAHYAPLIADPYGAGLEQPSASASPATSHVAGVSVTAVRDIHVRVVVDDAVAFDGQLGIGEQTDQFVGSTFVVTTSSGVNTEFTNACGDTFKMGHEEGVVSYEMAATADSCNPEGRSPLSAAIGI